MYKTMRLNSSYNGLGYLVRLVEKGDFIGRGLKVEHVSKPSVEVYLRGYRTTNDFGYLVSSYYFDTFEGAKSRGVCMDGSNRQYTLSAEDVQTIVDHFKPMIKEEK